MYKKSIGFQKRKNVHLEVVRGCACLLVILTHLAMKLPGNGYSFNPHFISFFSGWATEAVIIFFILSGLVITSSINKQQSTRSFITARLVRIYPILFVSVLISVIIDLFLLKAPVSAAAIVGNLIPISNLQATISPLLHANPVIWSLSFEVFFYTFFALFILGKNLIRKLNLVLWLSFSIICLGLGYFEFNLNNPIVKYLVMMFSFSPIWIIGVLIWLLKDRFSVGKVNFFFSLTALPLISRLHLTLNYYDPLKFLLFALTAVPFFIFLIQNDISRDSVPTNRKIMALQGVIYILATVFIAKDSTYTTLIKSIYISLPVISLSFSIKFVYQHLIHLYNNFIKPILAPIGKISYGLYLMHFPIITFFLYINRLSNPVKILFSILLFTIFSIWLEMVFQPFVKKMLKPFV